MRERSAWELGLEKIQKTHGYAAPADQRRQFEQAHEAEVLAGEILRLSRSTLLIHLRFMEGALLKLARGEGNELVTQECATDGRFFYYSPVHICRQFQRGSGVVARDYLHVTLHCLFRHLFVNGKRIDRDLWDLSCDIAVESLITDLGIAALSCERAERQRWLTEKLKRELPRLTAERIYRYLEQDETLPPAERARVREAFYADDHRIWYNEPELSSGREAGDQRETEGSPACADASADDLSAELEDDVVNEDSEEGASVTGGGPADDAHGRDGDPSEVGRAGEDNGRRGDAPGLVPEELERQWRELSERVQVDLETFSKSWGDGAGGMSQALREINRERCDYAQFLRRFSSLGENLEVNDEEFDYLFYTFGMNRYGNRPLVEPLEYREVKKVREFVVALDTSESVEGDLVQKFVSRTWNLLKQEGNFFSRVNVHILQCGARVEEDARITCDDDFDAYIRRMELKGFGGTDFRPVFEHVEELRRQHEFQNLRGLIYFTDGYGTYPPMPPDYEVAFVFAEPPDGMREAPDVPPWAIRILMTEDEIREL